MTQWSQPVQSTVAKEPEAAEAMVVFENSVTRSYALTVISGWIAITVLGKFSRAIAPSRVRHGAGVMCGNGNGQPVVAEQFESSPVDETEIVENGQLA